MHVKITKERPDHPDSAVLINELETELAGDYPAENRYGYSVDKLIQQGVHFFVMRDVGETDGLLLGCGGIQFYDTFGELKRMYVRPQYRGNRLGVKLLDHLTAFAREHNHTLVRLETGIHSTPAMKLYETYGFYKIDPFPPYEPATMSVCYELDLMVNR